MQSVNEMQSVLDVKACLNKITWHEWFCSDIACSSPIILHPSHTLRWGRPLLIATQ